MRGTIQVVSASMLLAAGVGALAQLPAQIPGVPGVTGGAGGNLDVQRKDAVRHSQATLIVEHAGVKAGGTVMLGIRVTIESGWHTYWNGRSDSGTPLTAEFELPAGWTLGEWQWPAPMRHVGEGDILDHIYEKDVTILVPLKAPEGAKVGETVKIRGKAEWLVCKEACVFEDGVLEASVSVIDAKEPPKATPEAGVIAASRARLPGVEGREGVKSSWAGDVVTVAVEGASKLEFFPAADCIGLVEPVYRTTATGGILRIKVDLSDPERRALRGVLAVTRPGDKAGTVEQRNPRMIVLEITRLGVGGSGESPATGSAQPKQDVPGGVKK